MRTLFIHPGHDDIFCLSHMVFTFRHKNYLVRFAGKKLYQLTNPDTRAAKLLLSM